MANRQQFRQEDKQAHCRTHQVGRGIHRGAHNRYLGALLINLIVVEFSKSHSVIL